MDAPSFPDGRRRRRPRHGLCIAAVLSVQLLAGCQATMTVPRSAETAPRTPAPIDRPFTGTVADWPLFFLQHNFGARCFDTLECRVLYAGLEHGSDQPKPSVDSFGQDYDSMMYAGHLGIRNFPSPAVVDWVSKDGQSHHAEIDIGEIFKDQLILHRTPREDIPEEIGIGDAGVVLEVDGRTINVYMRVFIPTKQLQIPGNRYSGHRNDLVLAFTRTY